MRRLFLRPWAALALCLVAMPARATAPVPVQIGTSRDGSLHDLQKVVDRCLGPGRIDVRTDYLGAHAGDPDPWTWESRGDRAVIVTMVDKKPATGALGWYREGIGWPALGGTNDGVLVDGPRPRGFGVVLRLPRTLSRFGFYVTRPAGGAAIDGDDERYTYFTNRLLNDRGPHGTGAVHSPWDGDVQMLVYDVSRWLGAGTWLVACEYSDSGGPIGVGPGQSDNDYSDIVFTISGVGVTPTLGSSFGRLKALYR